MSVQLGTNVGWYITYKVGGIVCTVRYERRLVHHVQSWRNCLYSYVRTSVGTSHTKSEELSVQLGTNVGWYIIYKVGGIFCIDMYERRLVLHVQSRRNCLYSYVRMSVGTSCTKSQELSVQLGTNVGWYITYKVGGIICTVRYERSYITYKVGGIVCTDRYERRLVHHVQSRRNCLYSYVRTSVGTSHTKREELSVQLCTNVGWYITYKLGGIVCTVMYERRLVHHIQNRRNCLYS